MPGLGTLLLLPLVGAGAILELLLVLPGLGTLLLLPLVGAGAILALLLILPGLGALLLLPLVCTGAVLALFLIFDALVLVRTRLAFSLTRPIRLVLRCCPLSQYRRARRDQLRSSREHHDHEP